MKDFIYYSKDKWDLHISDSIWLIDMGLRETHWILDARWFINRSTFNEWMYEDE